MRRKYFFTKGVVDFLGKNFDGVKDAIKEVDDLFYDFLRCYYATEFDELDGKTVGHDDVVIEEITPSINERGCFWIRATFIRKYKDDSIVISKGQVLEIDKDVNGDPTIYRNSPHIPLVVDESMHNGQFDRLWAELLRCRGIDPDAL
jgi:hypothetical protein